MIKARVVNFNQITRGQSYCLNLAPCMWLLSATRLITVQWKLYSEHEREFISRRNNADKCDLFQTQTRSDARNFYVTIKITWQVSMSLIGCMQARVIYRPAKMDLSCVIYRASTHRCGTIINNGWGTLNVAQKSFTVFSRNTRVRRRKLFYQFVLIFFLKKDLCRACELRFLTRIIRTSNRINRVIVLFNFFAIHFQSIYLLRSKPFHN